MCRVDFEVSCGVEAESSGGRKRRQRDGEEQQQVKARAPQDIMHPVLCSVCNTKLGLYDSDEVFHFLSVIASEP